VTPIDQMTEAEVRDYLAECMGWVRINNGSVPVEVPLWERRTKLPGGGVGVEESWCHPVPATLDAAAWCLPEGCWFCKVRWIRQTGTDREHSSQVGQNGWTVQAEAPTERHASFRAAAKAWAVVRKESGQ
jgi:hypothetical protein